MKLLYTLFLAVLVPVYLRDYGPTNFLYFCDVALFLTLFALWNEASLPASMAAVGICLPQIGWQADFLANALGFQFLGLTGYMFDPAYPVFTRFLSFFHFWLPLLLLWLVARLGYDRRACRFWITLALVVLLACFFLTSAPPAPADDPTHPVNINYVFGVGKSASQTIVPPLVWLAGLAGCLSLLVWWPTHLLFSRHFSPPPPQRHDAV